MIRNLKVLALTIMATAAFGALSAPGAHAAEELFHCEIEKCTLQLKPDGVGTTAHHVFILKKGALKPYQITCDSLKGEATTVVKTVEEVTFNKALKYEHCTALGETVNVDFNGCDYLFNSKGNVTIKCEAGKGPITLTIGEPAVLCVIAVPAQGPLNGIKYHDAGVAQKEITTEVALKGITATPEPGKKCKFLVGFEGETTTESEYTTGNTIVTAVEDVAPFTKHVKVWWA